MKNDKDSGTNTVTLHSEELRHAKVWFGKTEDAFDGFTLLLKRVIKTFYCKQILDVGGGGQPQLSTSELVAGNFDYTVMDISEVELARIPDSYNKIVMDIAGERIGDVGKYDLIVSRFVAEHISNVSRLHSNIFKLLNPGGIAIHFFPTLYSLPFMVNKVLPEWLSVRLLSKERQKIGKYVAYYRWCVGPTVEAVVRYEKLGYEVMEYAGFFGHGYYDSVPVLRSIHVWIRKLLLRHPVTSLTSFAWVILRKPKQGKIN